MINKRKILRQMENLFDLKECTEETGFGGRGNEIQMVKNNLLRIKNKDLIKLNTFIKLI